MSKCGVLLCVFLVALTVPALAGDIMQFSEEPNDATLMLPNSILVINSADQTITVFLASQETREKHFELPGGVRWNHSDEASSQYTIRIPTTGGRQTQHELMVDNRYEIFWSADAEVWDVRQIKR